MRDYYEKDAIRMIQRYLRQLSYGDKTIKPPPIDGIWEEDTEEALRHFQKQEGLAETGFADMETFDLLYLRYQESLIQRSAPVPLSLFPRISCDDCITLGDDQFLVRLMQFALREISTQYEGLAEVKESGIYDDDTKNGVRVFQERQGLSPTGDVNRDTWDALATTYNRFCGGFSCQ